MDKTVNNQDIAALAQWKAEDEELHRKRTELFVRLYANGKGLSQQRIADIYGCERQYVQQEIRKATSRVGWLGNISPIGAEPDVQ